MSPTATATANKGTAVRMSGVAHCESTRRHGDGRRRTTTTSATRQDERRDETTRVVEWVGDVVRLEQAREPRDLLLERGNVTAATAAAAAPRAARGHRRGADAHRQADLDGRGRVERDAIRRARSGALREKTACQPRGVRSKRMRSAAWRSDACSAQRCTHHGK